MPGVNHPMFYTGGRFSRFCLHTEDMHLNSVSYNHSGGTKVWYSVAPKHAAALEKVFAGMFEAAVEADKGRHRGLSISQWKTTMMDPLQLVEAGIPVYRVEQKPGDIVMTAPGGYHFGFNSAFNIAEAVNYASPAWFPIGEKADETQREMKKPHVVGFERFLFNEASSLCNHVEKHGLVAAQSDPRIKEDAKVIARCLANVVQKGEAAIAKCAKERNWRIALLKDSATAMHAPHTLVDANLQCETMCMECKGRDHFYAAVCGSCTDNPNALCVRHLGQHRSVCEAKGHRMYIVRRHDPDLLIQMLGVLEDVAGMKTDAVKMVERYKYTRAGQTPLRRSGKRIRIDLGALLKRKQMADAKKHVE